MSEQALVQASPTPQAQTVNPAPTNPLEVVQAAATTLVQLVESLQAAATPAPDPAPTALPVVAPAPQARERIEEAIGCLAASPVVRKSLARSSRLWTMVGTVATLLVQNPLGLNLSPVTQVCVAGVAAIYIAGRSILGDTTTGA